MPRQLKLIGFKKVSFEMTLNVSYSIGPLTLVKNISTWIFHKFLLIATKLNYLCLVKAMNDDDRNMSVTIMTLFTIYGSLRSQ